MFWSTEILSVSSATNKPRQGSSWKISCMLFKLIYQHCMANTLKYLQGTIQTKVINYGFSCKPSELLQIFLTSLCRFWRSTTVVMRCVISSLKKKRKEKKGARWTTKNYLKMVPENYTILRTFFLNFIKRTSHQQLSKLYSLLNLSLNSLSLAFSQKTAESTVWKE